MVSEVLQDDGLPPVTCIWHARRQVELGFEMGYVSDRPFRLLAIDTRCPWAANAIVGLDGEQINNAVYADELNGYVIQRVPHPAQSGAWRYVAAYGRVTIGLPRTDPNFGNYRVSRESGVVISFHRESAQP